MSQKTYPHDPEAYCPEGESDADSTIIDLLWARSEEGLAQLQTRYSRLCHRIALNLLGKREDAEECVNDVYLAVWDSIPPNRPQSLAAYVGKVTRNIAVSCLRRREAKGRSCAGTVLIDELAECLPDTNAPDPTDDMTLREALQSFFDSLPEEDRVNPTHRSGAWLEAQHRAGSAPPPPRASPGSSGDRGYHSLNQLKGDFHETPSTRIGRTAV